MTREAPKGTAQMGRQTCISTGGFLFHLLFTFTIVNDPQSVVPTRLLLQLSTLMLLRKYSILMNLLSPPFSSTSRQAYTLCTTQVMPIREIIALHRLPILTYNGKESRQRTREVKQHTVCNDPESKNDCLLQQVQKASTLNIDTSLYVKEYRIQSPHSKNTAGQQKTIQGATARNNYPERSPEFSKEKKLSGVYIH